MKAAQENGQLSNEKIQEIEDSVGPINTAYTWEEMNDFVSNMVKQSVSQV